MPSNDPDAAREAEMRALQDQRVTQARALLGRLVDDDELLDLMAALHRKRFLALREVGFSEEQALLITAHQASSSSVNP